MSASIGLDIGHSAVKIAVSDVDGKRHFLTIPTAICQSIKISDEVEAARATKETVRVGALDYFIVEPSTGEKMKIKAKKVLGFKTNPVLNKSL